MVNKKVKMLWEANLIDINHDKGLAKISSIISSAPIDIQAELSDMVNTCVNTSIVKEASDNVNNYLFKTANKLPIHSYSDIIISKLYLENQKDSIPTDIYKKASDTIDGLINIFNIPNDYFSWLDNIEKVADDEYDIGSLFTYMLPDEQLFPVYNKRDLLKVASSYLDNESKFLLKQKVEFSRNFVKKAMDYEDVHIPLNIAKYASGLDTDFISTYQNLVDRINWINIHCNDKQDIVDKLEKLSSDIHSIAMLPPKEQLPYKEDINSLNKLAYIINEIDESVGIGDKQYRKKIFPDAFGTVFNKVAGEVIGRGYTANDTQGDFNTNDADTLSNLNNIDKATIISTFGEDVLEDLEDANGDIDQERARKLLEQTGAMKREAIN